MDDYRQLQEHLRNVAGGRKTISIYQGIVKSVDGNLCEVTVGNINIPGVRLKASELADDGLMLITPKVGSAVTIGSLSGDLTELVVLHVDHHLYLPVRIDHCLGFLFHRGICHRPDAR